MKLKDYEQCKFELAEIIRSAYITIPASDYDAESRRRDLLARLADDRFTVVVAGRFSRGKSSLLNALFGMDRLPTGIVPLTSVITCARYGSSERVLLDYYDHGLRGETTLAKLSEYVTEKGNPGNIKRIRAAEIQLPAEILRRGFFFVDTPGLGSAILENSQTTERFIPEIDVLILVTSYESPLTEDEIRFLKQVSTTARAIYIVVNKHDTVPTEERTEVLQFVSKTVTAALNGVQVKPFSVSARNGLAAKLVHDLEALQASGIRDLEEDLVEFLTSERSQIFLVAMCNRVREELKRLPVAMTEPLQEELNSLQGKIDNAEQQLHDSESSTRIRQGVVPENVKILLSCQICKAVMTEVMNFLRQYQYDLSTQPETQEEHARNKGFCPQHTWHYEQIASPRGVCTAYPRLLKRIAREMALMANAGAFDAASWHSTVESQCAACEVRWKAEERSIQSILEKAQQTPTLDNLRLSALCLPHLRLLLQLTDNRSILKYLLLREAKILERIAEDMERYAIKHDGLRRWLASHEELSAPLQALQLLVGHRNVNAIFTIRDI